MIILDVHVGYIMSLYATLQHFNSCSARNVLCEVLVVLTVYLILDMANISLKLLFTARLAFYMELTSHDKSLGADFIRKLLGC